MLNSGYVVANGDRGILISPLPVQYLRSPGLPLFLFLALNRFYSALKEKNSKLLKLRACLQLKTLAKYGANNPGRSYAILRNLS